MIGQMWRYQEMWAEFALEDGVQEPISLNNFRVECLEPAVFLGLMPACVATQQLYSEI